MKFKVQTNSGKGKQDLLIPLVQGEQFSEAIQALATDLGLAAKALEADFKAAEGQVHLVYDQEGRRVYLLGMGKAEGFAPITRTIKKWIFNNKQQITSVLTVNLTYLPSALTITTWVEAIVQGAILGRYDIGLYKTDKTKKAGFASPRASLVLWVTAEDKRACQQATQHAEAIAKSQSRILDLMNAPSNKAKPQTLARWAKTSGKAHDFKVRILNKQQCEKTGLHALLAVNRGSEYPPAFIIMEYRPKKGGRKKLPKIGLVGKGVTFDTGGLSIKGAANMHYMKSDMGGAAAVLGAMEACAKLQLPVHLVGIIPATDNCVDARSVKPGDVIDSYSGKTIEIIDTDAEGRLILADGLSYLARNYQPDLMIDLATLTGSSVRTFGYHAAALFSNNEELAEQLREAGREAGERMWPLPLWDDYKEDIESDIADVRNFSGKPIAGAISAAKFLEVFTDEHPAWAHLDIAGAAFGNSGLSKQKSATGYGIRLLIQFLENRLASVK